MLEGTPGLAGEGSVRRRTLLLAMAAAAPARAEQPVTVMAAASLATAMQALGPRWAALGHAPPRLVLAASSTLARQIEQGAPADIFVSADEAWMDYLQQRGLIVPASRVSALGNSLVLVGPAGGPAAGLDALRGFQGRLAIGDPQGVPAGRYAKAALTALGLWDGLAGQLAPAENVRAALLLVERGEAPLGIVYATDAAVAPGVRVIATFPATSHPPVRYPFALTLHGDTPAARDLLQFLTGPAAAAVYRGLGFTILE